LEEVLNAKLKELKDIVEPILRRRDEAAKRPDAVKAFQDAVEGLKGVIPMVKEQIEVVASASSKSAEEASKSSASPTPSPSDSTDPLAELEDDEKLKASSSEAAEPEPEPTNLPTIYTPEDLKLLEDTIAKATKWLEDSQEKQGKLKATEDPAFTIQDLQDQTKKLNDAIMDMMMKKMQAFNAPKPKAKTKPKSKPKKKPKKPKAEKSNGDGESKSPTQQELDEALEKAGLKKDGIKLQNFGDMKGKDGQPLAKLELEPDATEEDIKDQLDRIIKEAQEKEKERKDKEKEKAGHHGDEL